MHKTVVARAAGAVFAPCFLVGSYSGISYGTIDLRYFWSVLVGVLLIALIGIWDDLKSLTPRRRFVTQLIAATFLVFWFFANNWSFFQQVALADLLACIALVFLLIMTSINFFNFADGINGFAGLSALLAIIIVIGFGHLVAEEPLFSGVRNWEHAFGCLAASIGIYLYFNVIKKSVFMGDSGSTTLGVIYGFLLLSLMQGSLDNFAPHTMPVWAMWKSALISAILWAGLVFFIFLDCGAMVVAKIVQKFPLTGCHKEHIFQKLAERFSHSRVTLFLCGLQAMVGILLFTYVRELEPGDVLIFAITIVVFISLPVIAWHARNLEKLGAPLGVDPPPAKVATPKNLNVKGARQ